jgi:hypothetical protein
MPVTVKGGLALRKALKKFTPDLAKETQKEMASLLRPITVKARGFVPSETPLSGWGKAKSTGKFPVFDVRAAKGGIGYKTTPSRPNRKGLHHWRVFIINLHRVLSMRLLAAYILTAVNKQKCVR